MRSDLRSDTPIRAYVSSVHRELIVIALGFAGATTVLAQDTVTRHVDTVRIVAHSATLHGVATTASQGRVDSTELRALPLSREGELLETVPGMIVTQHSGEGKANQYFARGFNLDHGTDFETNVDGMPVNMPSHAHGQGYTDLNFLLPELVTSLDYRLGVYYADVGDFSSAGSSEFHLARELASPFISLTSGDNGLDRVAAGASAGGLLAAGEVKGYDGPWLLPEEERKFSGLVRYSWGDFSILALGYHNKWRSNDQIPIRAIDDNLISRFGQIDSTDGGTSDRYSLSGSWRHVGARSIQNIELYGISSDLNLYSDFTYFLVDPVHGDQFNQREHRLTLGGKATDALSVPVLGILTVGLDTRDDLIPSIGLYHTEHEIRLGTVRHDAIDETSSGVFAEVSTHWLSWFRTELGLRGDAYAFDVDSRERASSILSPKAALTFTPSSVAELYLDGGFGFHSNDARAVTLTAGQAAPALVRSRGAEVGARLTPTNAFTSTVALWALDLDSELIYDADAGTNDPSSPSRRLGVTWSNVYRPLAQLAFDADISYAHTRFADVPVGETYVPGALENTVVGGVSWTPAPHGLFGALHVRRFGSYPLVQDNSVRAPATMVVNADVGYALASGVRVQLALLNLFNSLGDDIDYYYASRLPGEPAGGVMDQHLHPIEPRQLRVTVAWGL